MVTTRETILSAAADLFRSRGYSATGLNDIVAASGAPKGSLYHYFPGGKVQLAIEAVEFAGRSINASVAKGLDASPDPVKACQTVIRDIAAHFADGSDFMDVSLSIISLESSNESESLREICEKVMREREQVFAAKLRYAGYSQEEAEHLGALLLVLIEGAIVATRTSHNTAYLENIARYVPTLLQRSKEIS